MAFKDAEDMGNSGVKGTFFQGKWTNSWQTPYKPSSAAEDND